MALQQFLYDLLKSDPALNSIGYTEEGLFAAESPDSPRANLSKWIVIRWGVVAPAIARDVRSRGRDVTIWAYNREPDFGPINNALNRINDLLLSLGTVDTGSGWITEAVDTGSSEDLYDDGYQAVTRNWSYRIIASEGAFNG